MRILLIQTAFLGDIVMTTPLVRALRLRFPTAEIQMLTTEIGREVLGPMGEIDRLLVLDKRWNRRGTRSYLRLLRTLSGERFDIGIAVQRSVRSGVMLRLANPERSVGFDGAPGAWAYAVKTNWDPARHSIDRFLELGASLGVELEQVDRVPRLPIAAADRYAARRLIESCGFSGPHRWATIAPGSRWQTKRWTVEGFAEVAAQLDRRGLTPLLVGAPDERELCAEVARRSGLSLPPVAGRTTIGQLAAILELSELTVANDNGAAHLAAAVGTPVVALFGPTAPSQGYVPRGANVRVVERDDMDCRPCSSHGGRRCPLRHHECMVKLEASPVVAAIDSTLAAACVPGDAAPQPALVLPG